MKTASETTAIDLKVEELKKKHKVDTIYVVQVEGKVSYHRKPRLQEVSYAMTRIAQDPFEAYRTLLSATHLDGDREVFEDDDLLLNAGPMANEMIETKTASIVKY